MIQTFPRKTLKILNQWGGILFLAGVSMLTCFVVMSHLPDNRSQAIIPFLTYFSIASLAYLMALGRLRSDRLPLVLIWVFAILFRLLLVSTTPTLSDDIYRYVWDGHLINQGINPYTYAVNDPRLDVYSLSIRELVNHNWMASPYLPIGQLLFGWVYWLFPGSIMAFKIVVVFIDLSTGWLVFNLLGILGLPRQHALIYLWSPLVVVEFAYSAHIDALMIFFTMLAMWCLVQTVQLVDRSKVWSAFSALALAAATLTKGLPVLLTPLFFRRWGWRGLALYLLTITIPLTVFAYGAGWGLSGAGQGTGVFGALRIYMQQWNFNAGFYHWLEVFLSGLNTQGAVPRMPETEAAIALAKTISAGVFGVILLATMGLAWRLDSPKSVSKNTGEEAHIADPKLGENAVERNIKLLRLGLVPLGAYLLLTTTVHPWYVTMIIPFLTFLLPKVGETNWVGRFIWPWSVFSCTVVLSYLTYINPIKFQEYALVRHLEYLPFYLLLIWAGWPFFQRWINLVQRWIADRTR